MVDLHQDEEAHASAGPDARRRRAWLYPSTGPTGVSRVVFPAINVNPFFPQALYVKQWSDNNDLGRLPNWYFGTSAPGAGLGQQAPPFSLATVNGEETVSRAELSAFSRVAKEDPKVHFVGIDVADPSLATALSLARSAGISYPVLADRAGKVAAAYRVGGLPTTVSVSPAGRIDVVHPGAMTAEQPRYTLAQFFPNHTPQGG